MIILTQRGLHYTILAIPSLQTIKRWSNFPFQNSKQLLHHWLYWFIQYVHSRFVTRGHQFKLFKEHSRLLCWSNYFSNRISNQWNSLPHYVVDSSSINTFKLAFKALIDSYLADLRYTFLCMYAGVYAYVLIGYTGYAFSRILLIFILMQKRENHNWDAHKHKYSYNTPQTHVTINSVMYKRAQYRYGKEDTV